MSKVVRAIGGGIASVFKGVKKLVTGGINLIKKVAKSSIGKVVIGAALMYFGVPAVSGLFGSGAAAASGLSGLAGASANIGAAWSGLTSAGTSLMAGNFAQAGSQLAGGFTGMTGGLSGNVAALGGGGDLAGGVMGQGAGMSADALGTMTPISAEAGGQVGTFGAGVGNYGAATGGMLSGITNNPYFVPSLVQAGGGMLTAMGQQKARQEEFDRQRQLTVDDRNRYNTNVGTSLWGAAPTYQPKG